MNAFAEGVTKHGEQMYEVFRDISKGKSINVGRATIDLMFSIATGYVEYAASPIIEAPDKQELLQKTLICKFWSKCELTGMEG